MAEMFKGTLRTVYGTFGPMLELAEKEHDAYVVPATVRIKYQGRELIPTQFDERGNPQFGGAMREMLIWENQQLARDGKITGSGINLQVEYSYDVSPAAIEIPITLRLPKAGICPICGQPITLRQLDEITPYSGHPEYYYNGYGPSWSVKMLDADGAQPVVTHTTCYERYHTLRAVDEIMTVVGECFIQKPIDKENRLHWGAGENGLQVEEIPSKDLSKNDYVRKPWFRFRTPFGSFEIRSEHHLARIVLLADCEKEILKNPFPGTIRVNEDGSRELVCGSSPYCLLEVLDNVRRLARPDKPYEERLEELRRSTPATTPSFLRSLFSKK